MFQELKFAPLISECPINIECKLFKTVDLDKDTLFIGEIINTYAEEKYLTNGKPDVSKINPFVLTMPDNNYWSMGGWLQKSWEVGKKFK